MEEILDHELLGAGDGHDGGDLEDDLDAARLRLRVEEPHLGHGPRPAPAQQESTPHVIGGHMEAESSIRGARADLGDDSGHEECLEVTGSSPR